MIKFVKLNNRRLLRLRKMMPNIDGQPVHYVVSFVVDPEDCNSAELPVYTTTRRDKPYIWCERFTRVIYDFDLQIGLPIGHFFVSTLKWFVTPAMLSLVAMYLKGRGLVRKKTPHFGSFFLIGMSWQCVRLLALSVNLYTLSLVTEYTTLQEHFEGLALPGDLGEQ